MSYSINDISVVSGVSSSHINGRLSDCYNNSTSSATSVAGISRDSISINKDSIECKIVTNDASKISIEFQDRNYYSNYRIKVNIQEIANCINCNIKKVIFNDPATIVYWGDGSKTVVKCCKEESFDPEKGFAMAFLKKLYGNDNTYHKLFKEWVRDKEQYIMEMYFVMFASAICVVTCIVSFVVLCVCARLVSKINRMIDKEGNIK